MTEINTLSYATQLDEQDPLREIRSLFHTPTKGEIRTNKGKEDDNTECVYFCGNSLGLMPVSTEKKILDGLNHWKTAAVRGHTTGPYPWAFLDEENTPPLARLVGAANVDEVAIMGSLTNNIHTLLIPFYQPKVGDKRGTIIIEKGAFPSDLYVVLSHLKLHDRDPSELIELAPREGESILRHEDIISKIEELGERLALILLPGVQYYTGQVLDMEKITEAGHKVGAIVGFDLAHAVGNITLKLHEWNVDFAAWCSYKYLNSSPGGIAGIFVHDQFKDKSTLKRLEGWWGSEFKSRFKMTDPFLMISGARGFRQSNPAGLTVLALASSLEIYDKVGMDKFTTKSKKLTGYLEDLLLLELKEKIEIITPKGERGCQLSVRAKGIKETNDLEHRLNEEGLVGDSRSDIIRLAPNPLYNSYKDVYDCVQILKKILNK